MVERLGYVLWCLAFAGVAVSPALAQQTAVDVRVEYIAGQSVYLNAGTEAGIETGDTLVVHRKEAFAGTLRVVRATGSTSVVTYTDSPFPLTRGETVRVAFTTSQKEPAADAIPPTEPEDRPSILGAPGTRPVQIAKRPLRATGRIIVSFSSLRSTTTFRTSTERTFASPSASLRTRVTNLPGQFELNINARATYRYSTAHIVSPATLVRVYETSAERAVHALQLKAGRFSVRSQPLGSYWDGVQVRLQTGGFGIGGAAGLEPARADAAFSTELPKYSVFADFEHRGSSTSYVASLSFSSTRPRIELEPYSFVAASHRLAWHGLRLYQAAAVQRDPEADRWTFGLVSARATVPVVASVRIQGRYDLHRPYSYWRAFNAYSYRTERFGGGLSWSLSGMNLGGDVVWTRPEAGFDSRTISSFLTIPGHWFAGMGISASMSVWESEETSSYFVTGGLSRSFGSTYVRTSYGFDRTAFGATFTARHTLAGSVGTPISHGFHVLVSVRAGLGQTFSSTSIFTSLRKDF